MVEFPSGTEFFKFDKVDTQTYCRIFTLLSGIIGEMLIDSLSFQGNTKALQSNKLNTQEGFSHLVREKPLQSTVLHYRAV